MSLPSSGGRSVGTGKTASVRGVRRARSGGISRSRRSLERVGSGMITARRLWLRWIVGGFCLGVGMALAVRAMPVFLDAYLDASHARFDMMTDVPPGEASYLISFDNFDTLAELANAEEDIVDVNPGNFARIGRVTFAHANSPAIDRVRQHPNTAFLLSTTIPLICH